MLDELSSDFMDPLKVELSSAENLEAGAARSRDGQGEPPEPTVTALRCSSGNSGAPGTCRRSCEPTGEMRVWRMRREFSPSPSGEPRGFELIRFGFVRFGLKPQRNTFGVDMAGRS